MFGFDKPEDGSQDRFRDDLEIIDLMREASKISDAPEAMQAGRFAKVGYAFWWVVHNAIAHPMIGLLPVRLSFSFHDWTSRKMHP